MIGKGFFRNFSGSMLFSIDAKKDFFSTLFRIRMRAGPSARAYAAVSLLCWTLAIISGRLLP